MTQKYKGGRPSKAEIAYVQANAGRMTPGAIAEHLDRSPDWVLQQLKKVGAADEPNVDHDALSIASDLERSAAWRQLQAELSTLELAYFREEYVSLARQFKTEGLLHAERNQVFKLIKYDILMQRCLAQQRRISRDITHLERASDKIRDKYESLTEIPKDEATLLLSWDETLHELYRSKQDLTAEYVKLEEKHQRLMEALKATRDQRVRQLESAKVDFLDLIKSLHQIENRKREDRQQAMMLRAVENERKRLSQVHTYADGTEDIPLLTPEVIEAAVNDDSK